LNAIQKNLASIPNRYSVQYLLDCDSTNSGCDGGWMADAYKFVASEGLYNEYDYPRKYNGKKNTCAVKTDRERFYDDGGSEEDFISNERIRELL
jgi:Papain family cysteine protease